MARPTLTDEELESMRTRLTGAALDLYRREGLEAVSFRRLAEKVGLSHALPYRYFEDKDALLAEVRRGCFLRFGEYVRAAERDGTTVLARIRAVNQAYARYVQEFPADYLLMFSMEQPPPDRYPALLAARREAFEHVVELVQEGIKAGLLRGDAREIAHLGWMSMHGLMTLHVGGQLVHGRRLEQLVEPLIQNIIDAHAVRPSARRGTKTRRRA